MRQKTTPSKSLLFYLLSILMVVFLFNACSSDDGLKDDVPSEDIDKGKLKFPKKELRGVWIASVFELDWPQGNHDEASQKQLYQSYLDKFESLNINAVFFQIRPEGDAFYDSEFEPWSENITGTRGQDPGYDVLEYLIEETHKRGIEFHAWMNPYRISSEPDSYIDRDLTKTLDGIKLYNPALPEVRELLGEIVEEVLLNYEVDGLHFDDYFYPDTDEYDDDEEFEEYGADYDDIADFRRANVNKLIESIHGIVSDVKPEVVFSVSPTPNQTYNYETLFADVVKWNQEGWVDVVIPQLYQEIGNQFNDFKTNLEFWNVNRYHAKLMIGLGLYKFGDPEMPAAFQSIQELQDQFDLMDSYQGVVGSLSYNARAIMENNIGVVDKLKEIYKNPAVIPFAGRDVAPDPIRPKNIRISGDRLQWEAQEEEKYVVYYFADKEQEGEVVEITTDGETTMEKSGYYVVTSLNTDHKESEPSEAFQF